MATIDLGRIKFKWQGAWSSSTAYVVDDVVESGGNTYVCIAASTNNVPPNATYWELMAQKGTDTSVATTQGDIIYHNGTSLARLGAGTSGQALLTGGSGANPSWGDAGGAILQVKAAQYFGTTTVSTSSDGVDVSTLHSDYDHVKVDITPSSTSSKFFIHIGSGINGHGSKYGMAYIKRGIAGGSLSTLTGGRHFGNGTGDPHFLITQACWDAPNTTSVVNYRLFVRRHSTSTIAVNDVGNTDSKGPGQWIYVWEYDGSLVTITDS